MSELPCDIIEDLLPLYIEHVETEDTREVVEAHLAGCPVCREKAEQSRIIHCRVWFMRMFQRIACLMGLQLR